MTHRHFYIITSKPVGDDAGRIEESWYAIEDGKVALTDAAGVILDNERREIERDDPVFTAKLMLRARLERRRSGPNHEPISYDNRGWR